MSVPLLAGKAWKMAGTVWAPLLFAVLLLAEGTAIPVEIYQKVVVALLALIAILLAAMGQAAHSRFKRLEAKQNRMAKTMFMIGGMLHPDEAGRLQEILASLLDAAE